MLIRQLEYLDALAREGHFGRAAAACHVTQPALSNGLARLERELGLSLVRRGRQFEGLTPEGESILAWARTAISATNGLSEAAAQLREGLAGTLRLGLIPPAAARASALVQPFLAAHPGVRLHVETEPTSEIVARIADHRLDAGLVYTDEPIPTDAPLHVLPLYRERLVLLTSAALGADDGASVPWSVAASLPLGLLQPSMQNRRIVDRALRAAGVTAQIGAEADSIEVLVELGRAGASCIVSDRWLEGRALPDGVRVHPLTGPAVRPTIGLITARGALVTPTVRALREHLAPGALAAPRGPGR